MVASRSRHHLQRALPSASGEHGHRRGRLRSGKPLAESVRGTRDRLNPPRVFGPCDRAQCIASATHPHDVRALLSSNPDSPGAGEGCAGSAAGVAICWTDRRDSGSGRASSPLRAEGRVAPPPAPGCEATVPSAHPCTQLVPVHDKLQGALAAIARQLSGPCTARRFSAGLLRWETPALFWRTTGYCESAGGHSSPPPTSGELVSWSVRALPWPLRFILQLTIGIERMKA